MIARDVNSISIRQCNEIYRLTRHQFHHDHDRLLLNADADKFDYIRMIILLQYSPLLQKLAFLFVR